MINRDGVIFPVETVVIVQVVHRERMTMEVRDVLIVPQPPDHFLFAFGPGRLVRSGGIRIVPEEEYGHTPLIAKDVDHPLDLALGAVRPVLVLIHLDKDLVRAVIVLDLFLFGVPLAARVGHFLTDRVRPTIMRGEHLEDTFLTEFLMATVAMAVLVETAVIHAQTVPQPIQSSAFGAWALNQGDVVFGLVLFAMQGYLDAILRHIRAIFLPTAP